MMPHPDLPRPDLQSLDLPQLRALRTAIAKAIAAHLAASAAEPGKDRTMKTKAVTKDELVAAAAMAAGFRKGDAARLIDTVLAEIAGLVAAGDSVTLRGFGTFEPRPRAARAGRNPRTGEEIVIPARVALGFRPSKRGA